jgi:antirestriction protein ArdC
MSLTRRDVYQIITARITALLEQGTVPWHRPWTAQPPANLITHKPYRGVNLILLGCMPFSSPWWATYRQVQELGGYVRKGERGTPVCFWKWIEKTDEADNAQTQEDAKRIPVLRYYTVFNTDQCEDISQHLPPGRPSPEEPIAAAEAIVAGMPDPPRMQPGLVAAYSPSVDLVTMPALGSFQDAEAYHSTLFHELAHSTGHPRRLNRPAIAEACPFGSTNYSKEELVAEMAAAFLCAHAGINNRTVDNSAAYIAGWLERLSKDRTLMVHSAAAAQKGADYILGGTASTLAQQCDDHSTQRTGRQRTH